MTSITLLKPYLEAYDYVARHLPTPPSDFIPVIAGGAIRDILIPRHSSALRAPKDYDIFVLCPSYPGPYQAFLSWVRRHPKGLRNFLVKRTESSSLDPDNSQRTTRTYIKNFHHRIFGHKPGLDVIFIDMKTPNELLDSFDIGICKVAVYQHPDTGAFRLIRHPDFDQDLQDRAIRIHTNSVFTDEHIRKHAARLQTYYPDFTYDDSYFLRRDVAAALIQEHPLNEPDSSPF